MGWNWVPHAEKRQEMWTSFEFCVFLTEKTASWQCGPTFVSSLSTFTDMLTKKDKILPEVVNNLEFLCVPNMPPLSVPNPTKKSPNDTRQPARRLDMIPFIRLLFFNTQAWETMLHISVYSMIILNILYNLQRLHLSIDLLKNDVKCGEAWCYTRFDWLTFLTNQSHCV